MAPELIKTPQLSISCQGNSKDNNVDDEGTSSCSYTHANTRLMESSSSFVNGNTNNVESQDVACRDAIRLGIHCGDNDCQTQLDGAKADVYSFAMLLWALCVWDTPFIQLQPFQAMMVIAIQRKHPSRQRVIKCGWPQSVVDILTSAWQ